MTSKLLIAIVLIHSGMLLGVQAQPASAPATTATARRAMVMPPGFTAVTVGEHTAIVTPADETWARSALETLTPTTMPTTMPSDLIGQLKVSGPALKARIVKDLALSDPTVVDKFFAEKLEAPLERFHDINPPLFYMVTTRQQLKDLLKGGWTDPRFYYNRVADDVQFSPELNLTADGRGDDILLPVMVAPEDPPEKRAKELQETVRMAESRLAGSIATRAMVVAQLAFVDLVNEALAPLKLTPDQRWFGDGLAGVLSARYVAQINGMDAQMILQSMSSDDRRNPIRSATIDLLHPTPTSDLRPRAAPYYGDAFHRKTVRVVLSWLARAGDDAIPKTLTALKQNPPADGVALLKQIQQTSGVDLTAELAPEK